MGTYRAVVSDDRGLDDTILDLTGEGGASDGDGPGGLWGDHTEPRDCDVTCEVKCMGSHVTWGNRGTERLSDWPNAAQLVSGGGLVCVTLMPLSQ